MSETISYSFTVQVAGGPKEAKSDSIEVQAYDRLEIKVPDTGTLSGKAKVDVQPSGSGVRFLLVTASSYKKLTYKVGAGSSQTLDAPLLLIGEGAVKLLGASPEKIEFTNADTTANTVNILVGRDAST